MGYLSENFPYLHLVQQLLSSQTEHLDKDKSLRHTAMEVEREERSPTRGLTWSLCSSVPATSAPGELRLDSPLPQCLHFPACREDPVFVWSKIDWKGPRISVRTASPSVVCTSLQISHEFHIAGKSPKAMFSQGFAFCEEIPSD